MINNRQNGRRRGRGGPQVRNGAGGADRGNRIDNRARGNAAQLHEKYRNLARDAQTQGDRVMTEYYLQFADHYFRVLSESRARFEEQQPRRAQADDYDDCDDGDSYGPDDRVGQSPRFDRYERNEPRADQQRPDRVEQRADRPERGPRQPDRMQPDGNRPERGDEGERATAEDYRAPAEPESEHSGQVPVAAGGEGEPRRTRRGRRPKAETGTDDQRIEVDRLPPAFVAEPSVADVAAEPEEAPRRRRTRRPKDNGDSVAA